MDKFKRRSDALENPNLPKKNCDKNMLDYVYTVLYMWAQLLNTFFKMN